MNLTQLLTQRRTLLRQGHLANLAFAYVRLSEFAQRLDRAGLKGTVRLRHAETETGIAWPTLTVDGANASVVEEHFTDEDVIEWADVFTFITAENELDLVFSPEGLAERFLVPLRAELEHAGVVVDLQPPSSASQAHRTAGES